jgi:hypothetical protein
MAGPVTYVAMAVKYDCIYIYMYMYLYRTEHIYRAVESESGGILGGVGVGKDVPTPTPTSV